MAKKFENYQLDELLAMLGKKKKLLYQNFGVMDLAVFGSYARNQQKKDSDVDIVYLLKDKNKFGYFQYLDLEEMLSNQFKKKVELVNYKYMNPIIKQKAEKEIIYA
jgi:predicted nucleotidyltransferase